MQTKKMSLANIQGKLSRAEMKNIMAGSGGSCSTSSCTVYDRSSGTTYSCQCGYVTMDPSYPYTANCECSTSLGYYNPDGGTSSCWGG
jgi:hypothetical protein